MSDVWIGDIYEKKMKHTPPPSVGKFISKLFTRLAPGIVIDFVSEQPKVLGEYFNNLYYFINLCTFIEVIDCLERKNVLQHFACIV